MIELDNKVGPEVSSQWRLDHKIDPKIIIKIDIEEKSCCWIVIIKIIEWWVMNKLTSNYTTKIVYLDVWIILTIKVFEVEAESDAARICKKRLLFMIVLKSA